MKVSGKTGEGVEHLLEEVIRRVPPPKPENGARKGETAQRALPEASTTTSAVPGRDGARSAVSPFRALIFDFQYSNHAGVIVYIRVMNGCASRHEKLEFKIGKRAFEAIEVGVFKPDNTPVESLCAGEIGYIVTGIK